MRARGNPPDTPPPEHLDYEMWTGPAPMRPYNELVHPRSWRAFMEYGNGIVGDMCIHMLDMVRWMLDLGWPKRISSSRRHPDGQGEQGEHHRHADRDVRLPRPQGRLDAPHLGRPAGSEVSVGRDVLRRQGDAQGQRHELRLHAVGQGRRAAARGRDLRAREIPRGQDRKGSREARRAGDPRAHEGLSELHRFARQAGGRHRSRATSRPRPASSRTCRCSSAAR